MLALLALAGTLKIPSPGKIVSTLNAKGSPRGGGKGVKEKEI